jgi:phosphate transport system permease protein
MAVLMVAGNVVQYPTGLFKPVRVLTANIALEMAYATGAHRAGLFTSGLLLMGLVMLLAWLAIRVSRGARYV